MAEMETLMVHCQEALEAVVLVLQELPLYLVIKVVVEQVYHLQLLRHP